MSDFDDPRPHKTTNGLLRTICVLLVVLAWLLLAEMAHSVRSDRNENLIQRLLFLAQVR